MDNSLIDQIHAHASVRHYKSDPLTETMVREIVSAGQRASTSSNLQLYSVIAISDQIARIGSTGR
jgi:FMN reductase (NADPH)